MFVVVFEKSPELKKLAAKISHGALDVALLPWTGILDLLETPNNRGL